MPAGSPSRLRTGRRYEKETADPRQNRPGRQSALGAAALVMTEEEKSAAFAASFWHAGSACAGAQRLGYKTPKLREVMV
jgi:hypothetical protein